MGELTADQAADFLRGLGWRVFRSSWFANRWIGDSFKGNGYQIGLSDAELIALAKEKGAGS